MAHRKRPSFVDISSDDEDDTYETPTPSPDDDYAPSSEATTPSSTNSNGHGVDDEDLDVIRQNQTLMDVNRYGTSYEATGDGVQVRRSKRARRPTQTHYSPPSDFDEDDLNDEDDTKPFGVEDATIDGEWIGTDDSEDEEEEEDEDEETFYAKHPEMRGFVVSDSDDELWSDNAYTDESDMDIDDDEDSMSSSDSITPKATPAELKQLLKPKRCKKSDEDSKCPICVRHFRCRQVYVELPACHHRFHQTCIRPWLLEHNRCCPTCRTDVAAT